jgi:lysophospholipase L1-like esterase
MKKILYYALMVAFTLAAIELLIALAFLLHPPLRDIVALKSKTQAIRDTRLGHRPNPIYPEHDANGFRNSSAPSTAEVVCLGDSQTYGVGVAAESPWPQVLHHKLMGPTVYNMAYGGWGPAHSLLLWDEVRALQPAVVVEAFYAGNDLYDSYQLIYAQNQLEGLRSPDADLKASMSRLDSELSLQDEASLIKKGRRTATVNSADVKDYLKEHWRLYGVLMAVGKLAEGAQSPPSPEVDPWKQTLEVMAKRPDLYYEAFSSELARTVFTPDYRLVGLDLGDPRIREGLRISLAALWRMHQEADALGSVFIVALIPTKELVFEQVVRDSEQDLRPSYFELLRQEKAMWEATRDFLDSHGIRYVDTLPTLSQSLKRGKPPYQVSDDGHPNEMGHKAIADAVYAKLEALSLLERIKSR